MSAFDIRKPSSRPVHTPVSVPESFRREIPEPRAFRIPDPSIHREVLKEKKSSRPISQKGKRLVVGLGILFLFIIAGVGFDAFTREKRVLSLGEEGVHSLESGIDALRRGNISDAGKFFQEGEERFRQANKALGPILPLISDLVPVQTKLSSGIRLLQAGEHLSRAGNQAVSFVPEILSIAGNSPSSKISFLDVLQRAEAPIESVRGDLSIATDLLSQVREKDIPSDKRDRFLKARERVLIASSTLDGLMMNRSIFEELLGGNGPRKYLFLFQNNHELRATGGFIGSYGLLDIRDGVIRNFFVDGIFNPDGQLKENIVPPKPLQKISAGWSLHDSNWYPDFPTSAEKAIFFYEKTGGPTVDGVIALTPSILESFLRILGPIDMPEYGITIDADTFIPLVQEQVEEKYDREENKPKKILGDLAVVILSRVAAAQDHKMILSLAEAVGRGLNERQALLYARDKQTQELLDRMQWSGRLLETDRDYLSVVHSNINGYKTDGVIDETIAHEAEIGEDGSVIDTLTITRTHNGGNTPYEWWNKVNADYLRVYVPEGSELISVKGTTWEFPKEPLDYDALRFRRDLDVEKEEKAMRIDEKSGTRISTESGKTVFGAWVYVSPQESVTVEIKYKLPFQVQWSSRDSDSADRFSVLYQKQSGSLGSKLEASIVYPEGLRPVWQTGGNLIPYGRRIELKDTLTTNKFLGAAFVASEKP